MWRSRTFWRLFGGYGLLILGSMGIVGGLVGHRVEQNFQDGIRDSLRTKAYLVGEAARDKSEKEIPHLQERIKGLRPQIATRITLIAVDGRVLADTDENPEQMDKHDSRPEVLLAREDGFGTAIRHSDTVHQPMMYGALRLDHHPGVVAFVRVALPLGIVQEQLQGLRRLIWTAAGVTALAAMALAFWLVRRFAQPLQELTEGVERISAGGFGHKVYVPGKDEIGVLAETFNQMSERLAAQFAQLEADRQQLRAVLSGMVEGVVALDAQQRILFSNERAAQLLEFDAQAAAGRKLYEVVRQRAIQEIVRRALAAKEPQSQELTWNEPDPKSLAVHAARLPGAPARGLVLVLHDTSELRRLERLRQEFVANVSHELKTPLSVIKACIETLLDGAAENPEDRASFLQQVAEQGDRLHWLILDLLSLARIESGTEAFEFQAVPLADLVQECLERHRTRAEAKRQTLEGSQTPSAAGSPLPTDDCRLTTDVTAWADEEAVNQILDNLVDNAMKYTPEGGRIQVRWSAEDGQAILEVEDTGIGIPEHDLPRIFERFYRVDKARSRELGGTGLGLSIVKHLVQAMHGSVRAASRVGQGTNFSVRLPRASPS